MAARRPNINTDIDQAIGFFRPILQRLRIRDNDHAGEPVFMESFPHLWSYNLDGWAIVVIRANLKDPKVRAKFVAQYIGGRMTCYIILDEVLYVDSRVTNEERKMVAVHEFCHFVALAYASICSTTEELLLERLKKRLSKVVDELTDDDVLKLFQFLDTQGPFENGFSEFEHTRDSHFRLGYEDLDLSYEELFKNFMMSRQMFDEYFSEEEKKEFVELFHGKGVSSAMSLYLNIAKQIAVEKWFPEKFAINRAIDILTKSYFKELLKKKQ